MTSDVYQPATPRKWYEIWWDVWSHPGIASFQRMLSQPDHDTKRGFIWVGVMSFIITLASTVFSLMFLRYLTTENIGTQFSQYSGIYTISYICGVILSPIFAMIGIAISAGIYHLFAKLFGGNGIWSDLIYCMSAVTAPSTLFGGMIGMVSLLFYQIPVLIFIPIMVAMLFSIYALILNVNAIRAAENIGTGQAIGTLLIPVVIIGVLVACCSILSLIPFFSTIVNGQ